MKTKITEVELLTSNVIRTRPMYQWDTGQILKITDTTFPDGTAVQFGNETMRCVLETYMQDNQVTIPAEALRQRRDLTAYIVIEDESSDTTEYEILIPVIPKPKPEDYAGEPEVQRIVKIINQTADKVQALAEAAETSATDAADSAASAEASKNALESGLQELAEVKTGVVQNTKEIQKTNRSLDALWKLNNGISYQYETDSETAYQKTVPSGAKICSVSKIGGKTLVWNQLNKNDSDSESSDIYNCNWVNNSDGTITATGMPNTTVVFSASKTTVQVKSGHKYLLKGAKGGSETTYMIVLYDNVNKKNIFTHYGNCSIYTAAEDTKVLIMTRIVSGYDASGGIVFTPQLFDLAQMFGAGNEPATVEEFEAMFPLDYYPYSAGELISFPLNEMVNTDASGNETIIPTPQAILDLDGYGVGINDKVYNLMDKENKLYRKRIGAVDLGTLNWVSEADMSDGQFRASDTSTGNEALHNAKYLGSLLCVKYTGEVSGSTNMSDKAISLQNAQQLIILRIKDSDYTGVSVEDFKAAMSGVMCYFELYEEEVIDISDILTDDEPFEVEAGGSLTFKNSNGDGYRVPIPTEEKYIISLAEVSGVTV